MATKLMTTLAIIAALMASAIADGTSVFSNSSAGAFRLPLFANQGRDHTIRRGTDGFLYLQQHSLTMASTANTTNLIRPQFIHSTSAHFGTGQAKQTYILALDATGILTWIQCIPCSPAATQRGPLFNPVLSPTFQHVHYTNRICRSSPQLTPDPVSQRCNLSIFRQGRLWVQGVFATDQCIRSDGHVFPQFKFGCVHQTRLFPNYNMYAGIAAYRPVAMQAAAEHGLTRSSYCLFRETNRQGFLRFGAEAYVPHMPHYQTTRLLPMVHDANESAYHVSLVGVSLGGRRLNGVRPETFALRGDAQGGCIIDLGTPLTVMVETAYRVMEEAVWSNLERHDAERVEQDAYGLCVRATEAIKGRLQPLLLHFAGEEEEEATLVVSPKELFLMMDDGQAEQVACLAMVPGRRTIIGALQQVDTRFVFDLKENKVSFAPESCIEDTIPVD